MFALFLLPILIVLFFGYQAMRKNRLKKQRARDYPDRDDFKPGDFG
ncbi:hypothetical protein [Ponticaulis profundi]